MLAQNVAKAIGWDGMGNPLEPPLPPLPPLAEELEMVVENPVQPQQDALLKEEQMQQVADLENVVGEKQPPTPVLDTLDDVGDELADKAPVASTAIKTTVELNKVRKAERAKVFSATSEAIEDVVGSATDGDKDTKVVDAVKTGRESIKEARKDAAEAVSDAMQDRRTAVHEAVQKRLSPTEDADD